MKLDLHRISKLAAGTKDGYWSPRHLLNALETFFNRELNLYPMQGAQSPVKEPINIRELINTSTIRTAPWYRLTPLPTNAQEDYPRVQFRATPKADGKIWFRIEFQLNTDRNDLEQGERSPAFRRFEQLVTTAMKREIGSEDGDPITSTKRFYRGSEDVDVLSVEFKWTLSAPY